MVRMSLRILSLAALACLLASPPPAAALTAFDYQTIDVPGAAGTHADAMNNRGTVVGYYYSADDFRSRGFLKDGDTVVTVDHPRASVYGTVLSGINDRGDAVGYYFDTALVRHGFVLPRQGTLADLPEPAGLTDIAPFDINNAGAIVGVTNGSQGFVLSGGTYRLISYPGADLTLASGINEQGDVVGLQFTLSQPQPRGYLLSGGVFSLVGGPGFQALDVTGRGDIVGWTYPDQTSQLFAAAGASPVLVPGSQFTFASGSSDDGQIVGSWRDAAGNEHGFVARPRNQ